MRINFKKTKDIFLEVFLIITIFVIILSFFDHTHWNGIEEKEDKSIIKKIFNRYYFITATVSSVGFGDISPKSYICKFIVSTLNIMVAVNIVSLIGNF